MVYNRSKFLYWKVYIFFYYIFILKKVYKFYLYAAVHATHWKYDIKYEPKYFYVI